MSDDQKKGYREESIGSKLSIILGALIGIGIVIYGAVLYFSSDNISIGASAVKTQRAEAATSAKAGAVTQQYAGLSQTKDDENYQRAVEIWSVWR